MTLNIAELDRQVLNVYAQIAEILDPADQRIATQLWWQHLTDTCTLENPCIKCQREHAAQELQEDQTEPELTPEEYEEMLWQESPYEAMYYADIKEEERLAAEAAVASAADEAQSYAVRDFAKEWGG
jgi:hypothetical protein